LTKLDISSISNDVDVVQQ